MSMYKYLAITLFLLVLGFSLMAVGPSSEIDSFRQEIFNPVNISFAPILILLAYAAGMLAIFKGKHQGF